MRRRPSAESSRRSGKPVLLGSARLGNVIAAALLRRQRGWCGQLVVASDAYGRVHFPGCDWVLVLVGESPAGRELLANRALMLTLDARRAVWSFADGPESPLVNHATTGL